LINLINFTIQDILGSILAFALFPLIFVCPGYVCACILNLFDFKIRQIPARLAISTMISTAISPILFFLFYRIGSSALALSLIVVFLTGFIYLLFQERKTLSTAWSDAGKSRTLAVWIFAGWSLFAILSLIDIQFGDRLYYSVASLDLITRVSVTGAITRTGVPPINPGYFPGRYVQITFLYYFWYILSSLIDQIGGRWVDARMAMIASSAWCGIGLMSTISVYLRLRNPWNGAEAWKCALLGIGALTISGLDILPALTMMLRSRFTFGKMWLDGDIEHWNEQITAWLVAVTWVPHHVAGMVVCVVALLLIQSVRGKNVGTQVASACIAGLALASASGLTIHVTVTFALFWAMWMLVLFLNKEYRTISIMLFAGVFALSVASPYLFDLIQGYPTSSGGGIPTVHPIAFRVRLFSLLLPFLSSCSMVVKNLLNLAVLPFNYFMELGFYFVVGLLWLRKNAKTTCSDNIFYMPEILLLGASFLVASFFRSTIAANDLGWRGWMFGQFVLLIWAVDIGRDYLILKSDSPYSRPVSDKKSIKDDSILRQLMVIGMLTTVLSMFLLRFWPILIDAGVTGVPVNLSPDTQLGARTYAARQAYEYMRDCLPKDVIVQYNPLIQQDRPSGLYGNRQMATGGHSDYGALPEAFESLKQDIGAIFRNTDTDWIDIDQNCKQHEIDVIILSELDPLWQNLLLLSQQRVALYQNSRVAVFACGDFAGRQSIAAKMPFKYP
jgi:hypothetical protein